MAIFDRKTAQVLATILAFAAALWLLYGLRELFFLFLLAVFFAYTVEPLIAFINRNTPPYISRRKAIYFTFIVVFLACTTAGLFFGQLVTTQAADLMQQLPSLDEDPSRATSLPLPSQLEPFREELTLHGLALARTAASNLIESLGQAAFLLLSPIFAIFFLLEGPAYRTAIIQLAARSGDHIWLTGLLDDLHNLLSNYIRALFLQSLSVFVAYAFFYQAVQVPYALLLATLAAALEIIPVLGWISAGLLSMLVAGFVGYSHLLWMFGFYLAFRLFQDYVVTPYLMQKGIQLPALLILAGVIGGEMLGGIRGMFLSIPTLAAIRILYRHWLKRAAPLLLLAVCAMHLDAHAISVSASDATLNGTALTIDLKIPRYEAEHTSHDALIKAFRITGAQPGESSCKTVDAEIVCDIRFNFPSQPGEVIEANVSLARVTVPNHVHIMRLHRGNTMRQAIFDRTFEDERIDMREIGQLEVWWRSARMGFTQLIYQPVVLLLLILISRPGWFLTGASVAFLAVLPDRFYAVPGFFELATSISVTYLAIEHLFFADASGKWLLAATIGALEGTALAVLSRPSGPGALPFGAGNLLACFAVTLFASRFSRNIPAPWMRKILWALTATGALWSVWVFVKRF